MRSLWDSKTAKKYLHDPLALRVYTSRLLGQEPDLVLHGGGNTSVKTRVKNLFGDSEHILYVKGSGWDLATIEKSGFAPVKMDTLVKMARLRQLDDAAMVNMQRSAMTDPHAPNPSVEAILHAIIPFRYVDHTHADAIIAITNTPNGEKRIGDIYGQRVIVVPYVMPGFILARKIYEMTRAINWKDYQAMILLNHGVFTFDDDAQKSYAKMIRIVTKAEQYLKKNKAVIHIDRGKPKENLLELARIRRRVSKIRGAAVLARIQSSPEHLGFSNLKNVRSVAARGPLTPDHVIRTKIGR